MLRACEYCVGRGEKVFGHYDRTDQKYFGHCAKKKSVNDRQMTGKKNLESSMKLWLLKLSNNFYENDKVQINISFYL